MFFNFVQHANPAGSDQDRAATADTPPTLPAVQAQVTKVVSAHVPIIPAQSYVAPTQGIVSLVGERIAELPLHLPAVYRRHISDIHFAIASADDSVLSQTITDSTDLIPGVYEGGAKTWECSVDLARFLLEEGAVSDGSRVLELGCGSAVPSLALLASLGPSLGALTLQDYNVQVLELVTVPNVLLNTAQGQQPWNDPVFDTLLSLEQLPGNVSFVSGDWSTMLDTVLPHDKYDVILTSETIYSSRAKDLLTLIEARLATHGRAFVAAKSSYFGCAGSIPDFVALVQESGLLTHRVVRSITDRGVRCEILELTHV